jgi:hypothetical protein
MFLLIIRKPASINRLDGLTTTNRIQTKKDSDKGHEGMRWKTLEKVYFNVS